MKKEDLRMTIEFYTNIPGITDRKNNAVSVEKSVMNQAVMLGLNLESFYEVDSNGVKTLNIEKLMTAISEAEEKKEVKKTEEASQSDSFVKSVNNKTNDDTAAEASEKQNDIDKEYKEAFVLFYKNLNTAADAGETSKKAADLWEDVKYKHFNLTKTGVSSATVIAGASDCISKLQTAVDISKESIEEEKKNAETNFFVNAPAKEETANYFANNPFYQSALELSKKDAEDAEEVAA